MTRLKMYTKPYNMKSDQNTLNGEGADCGMWRSRAISRDPAKELLTLKLISWGCYSYMEIMYSFV